MVQIAAVNWQRRGQSQEKRPKLAVPDSWFFFEHLVRKAVQPFRLTPITALIFIRRQDHPNRKQVANVARVIREHSA